MLDCVPFALTPVKTIFVPSGDQPGSKQEIDLGSENAPPHQGVIGSWCSPLPSALTTQIARRWSGAVRATNRIVFPLGDQLPAKKPNSRTRPDVGSFRSPLPSSLVTKRPTRPVGSWRTNTRRLPLGEQTHGGSRAT